MNDPATKTLSKVPAVTLGFWIIKIAATTLGETGGDWVTMSLNLGYLAGSAVFLLVFMAAVAAQISAKKFHPYLYWFTILATTTLGTTLADFCDRSLGAGYFTGMSALFALLLLSLALWYWRAGTVAVETVDSPRIEKYYWVTILFSQTLGTALGDFMADGDLRGLGLGYEWSALIFIAALAVVAALWLGTRLSRAGLFWAAFILTRPLGATLGDFLDKPLSMGGLNLSRFYATLALLVFIVICIRVFPQKPGAHLSRQGHSA
ncbi:MAG: hypothetical protein LBV61_11395 [Burkholderiaceae bacterium]|jgi:uncharacterized membrane-anchored protein|nr:hypothetical protein [Burkholderiaceae bacterium]